jgi:ribosomal subunit interface protein
MSIQVTGKNVDAGDAFKSYIADRVPSVLGKYIGPDISGHVRLEKERNKFRTTCTIRMKSGLLLEGQGDGGDAYSSADAALEHLEKRVRRHKRRLKSHHTARDGAAASDVVARDFTVRVDQESDGEDEPGHPVIIAETERGIREMPVSEAVMQLDVTESPFLLFRNASHGDLNIVYRRADGHIGWIDPNPSTGTNARTAARPTGARGQR